MRVALVAGGAVLTVGVFAGVSLWRTPTALPQVGAGLTLDCPQTSVESSFTGTALDAFTPDRNGVVYDATDSRLELRKLGGNFQQTTLGITDNFSVLQAGDFDEDGWDDLVVGGTEDRFVRFYKNRTYENAEPDWSDPTAIRQPKFVRTVDVVASTLAGSHTSLNAGDFNGDGHLDVIRFRNEGGDYTDMDYYQMFLGNGDGTFQTPYSLIASPSSLGYHAWTSQNTDVADFNGDGWLDIIFGTMKSSVASSGAVLVLLNDCPDVAQSPPVACSQPPKFVAQDLLTGLDFGSRGANVLRFQDFTNDGYRDLIVGSASACTDWTASPIRLWPGLPGGALDSTAQTIPGFGSLTVILSGDFGLDGTEGIITGTDDWQCGTHPGGNAYYYANGGGNEPFAAGAKKQLTAHQDHIAGNIFDYDGGTVLDYDHDPEGTPDIVIADGNHSNTFFLFANRTSSNYIECGDVSSGVLDLGGLETVEMVVSGARLSPTATRPVGTTITYYLTNEDPANWVEATPCADDPSDYCVSFPKPVGRDVRWKAEMCSNPSHNTTPTISGVAMTFDYEESKEHYRAGLVAHDGVAYIPAFKQPGDRGRLYATDAALSQTYWEAGAKLDAMADSSRNIYTSALDGTRLDFTVANAADANMQTLLAAASQAQAAEVISWARSARFGVDGFALTKLGGVELSTPAVVPAPGYPVWYPRASTADKNLVDAFIANHADRRMIVLFGSRDGMLHAIRNDPTAIADASNGTEAWAYVPTSVARSMLADKTSGVISAYPDGSPTVADVKLSDNQLHTVAIVSEGNGGTGVFALDITETIDEATDVVLGPTLLWSYTPGGASAGQAYSKPAIARTKINGSETYLAIFGSGLSGLNPSPPYTMGREVVAIDIATGQRKWRFQAACPLTSDIAVYESDDEGEPTAPSLDSFIDLVVFADRCGNVYKLSPNHDLPGALATDGWATAIGGIDTGTTDPAGQTVKALFSTTATVRALGAERPITGTIGVREDETGRIVLFFGTGGLENFDPTLANAFYAVYSDTGEVRSVSPGTCSGGMCEKFYGGVVVSSEQVILTRAFDPPIGSPTCDAGSSVIQGFKLNDTLADAFVQDFASSFASVMVAPLYGQGNAIYTVTLTGEAVRLGTPRAAAAGEDTAAGHIGQDLADDENADGIVDDAPFALMGWRQM